MENLLYSAVKVLAERSGYGILDGVLDLKGYNMMDSEFGCKLARIPFEGWSTRQKISVYKMIGKYRKQLSVAGIQYEDIYNPEKDLVRNRKVGVEGDYFIFSFGEDVDFGQLLYSFKGFFVRRFYNPDKGVWNVPTSCGKVQEFVEENNFQVDLEVIRKFSEPQEVSRRIWEDKAGLGKYYVKFLGEREIIDDLKKIPCRRAWDGVNKQWELIVKRSIMKEFSEFSKKYEFVITEKVKEEFGKYYKDLELSKSFSSGGFEFREGFNLELRSFQKSGVAYAVNKKKTFIADEMGLGKTIESLATVYHLNSFPVLVVCPATLKYNWKKETRRCLGDKKIYVLKGRADKTDLSKYDVIIANYDVISYYEAKLNEIGLEAVIFDESQYLKNYKAKRSKSAQSIADGVGVVLFLTGTPVLNRPSELIHPLCIIKKINEFPGGFWGFAKRYCEATKTRWGWDMNGASNLEEMNERMRVIGYVRRKKSEVLKELPDKQRVFIEVDISNKPEYRRAEKDLIGWLKENTVKDREFLESIKDLDGEDRKEAVSKRASCVVKRAERAEQLVRIETLKQVVLKGKKKAIKEWIEDFVDMDQKLVVFGHHVDSIKEIAKDFNFSIIIGSTPGTLRQQYVDKFQEGEGKGICLGIKAGGVGTTLTAASNELFTELGWTPAEHDQAEDRCHRIGQKNMVTVYYMIAKNTIEEDILELLEEKRKVVNTATDGEDSGKSVKIMGELIKRLTER